MRLFRNLIHKLLLCATFRKNGTELIICEHIRGWRLVTPQMESLGTLDLNGMPIGTDQAFDQAIAQAREVGDVVTITDIESLHSIFNESFGDSPGEFAAFSVNNGKG